MNNYTIGADPELFLRDNNTGEFISAHPFFKGDKYNPETTDFGAIQVDGVAVEFNTKPAQVKSEFLAQVGKALEYINEEAGKFNLTPVIVPTATFDKIYFQELPMHVQVLGCEADYNIYSGKQNPPPGTSEPFRTGAGHIHFGWGDYVSFEDDFKEKVHGITGQCDAYLYFKSLEWDDDDRRRSLYGKIGSFRYKSYGVEYRPLSNKWLESKERQGEVFDICTQLLSLYDQGVVLQDDPLIAQACQEVYWSGKTNVDVVSYVEKEYNIG